MDTIEDNIDYDETAYHCNEEIEEEEEVEVVDEEEEDISDSDFDTFEECSSSSLDKIPQRAILLLEHIRSANNQINNNKNKNKNKNNSKDSNKDDYDSQNDSENETDEKNENETILTNEEKYSFADISLFQCLPVDET